MTYEEVIQNLLVVNFEGYYQHSPNRYYSYICFHQAQKFPKYVYIKDIKFIIITFTLEIECDYIIKKQRRKYNEKNRYYGKFVFIIILV